MTCVRIHDKIPKLYSHFDSCALKFGNFILTCQDLVKSLCQQCHELTKFKIKIQNKPERERELSNLVMIRLKLQ